MNLIGKKFISIVADAACTFEVVDAPAEGIWKCVTTPDSEYQQERYLPTQEVKELVQRRMDQQDSLGIHESLWAKLDTGTFLHYHVGSDKWVRCEVVVYDPNKHHSSGLVDFSPGDRVLKPIALRGAWTDSELGECDKRTGQTRYSYHAATVIEGTVFWVNTYDLYEISSKLLTSTKSPLQLPDLKIAENKEDPELARRFKLSQDINDVIRGSKGSVEDFSEALVDVFNDYDIEVIFKFPETDED